MERERKRMAQHHERMNGVKEQREQQFWKELFAQTPLPTPPPSQHNGTSKPLSVTSRLLTFF